MILSLKQQVTSLDLSKKLKEIGFPQETVFYWTRRTTDKRIKMKDYGVFQGFDKDNNDPEYSAYTTDELMTLLPNDTNIIKRHDGYYICNTEINCDVDKWIHCRKDDTKSADACAKILIYITENNLMSHR